MDASENLVKAVDHYPPHPALNPSGNYVITYKNLGAISESHIP